MSATYFDYLSIELIHEIFSYLSCHQILQSFHSISDYLDAIIGNYQYYYLDFSLNQIRKKDFDLLCLLIHPQQIIGLKLGQNWFNLITKYLNGRQTFSRLRSLSLEKSIIYNEQLANWIHTKIDYNHLRLFRFDPVDKQFFPPESVHCFENLSHLVGYSSTIFQRLTSRIPVRLTFVHMFFNSIHDLICLLNRCAPQLKSLGIGIRCQPNEIDRFSSLFKAYQWNKLIQFNLNLQGRNISFHIQCLLSIVSYQRSTKFDGRQFMKSYLTCLD